MEAFNFLENYQSSFPCHKLQDALINYIKHPGYINVPPTQEM